MRLRWPLLFTAICCGSLALAQSTPIARQLLKDAEERADLIRDKDSHAYNLSQIAKAWRPIDKKESLADLNKAADILTGHHDSWAWRDILSVWIHVDADSALQQAIALSKSGEASQEVGSVIAALAPADLQKATRGVAEVPSSQRQAVAEVAAKKLAVDNPQLVEKFIQGLPQVKPDSLWHTVAMYAKDSQLALRAAQQAGDEKPEAMFAAIRKVAQDDPTLAHGLIAEIPDAGKRAIALAVCAQSFYRMDPDRAAQCATEAIQLYASSPPDWNSRTSSFAQIEPILSGIDSPDVREFLSRYCQMVETHFQTADDDEIREQPRWLISCAAAWSRLDLEKARDYANRALLSEPYAGLQSSGDAGSSIRTTYQRYLVELGKSYPEETATRLANIKETSAEIFKSASRSVIMHLLPDDLAPARLIAQQFGGGWPNFVEAENDLLANSPDNAADGLLRWETDFFENWEFWGAAEEMIDLLIQTDPYRAARAVINMDSAAHRVPLLSRIIVAIAKTNSTLADSTYEKATQDLAGHMSNEDKVFATTELAKAAAALGH